MLCFNNCKITQRLISLGIFTIAYIYNYTNAQDGQLLDKVIIANHDYSAKILSIGGAKCEIAKANGNIINDKKTSTSTGKSKQIYNFLTGANLQQNYNKYTDKRYRGMNTVIGINSKYAFYLQFESDKQDVFRTVEHVMLTPNSRVAKLKSIPFELSMLAPEVVPNYFLMIYGAGFKFYSAEELRQCDGFQLVSEIETPLGDVVIQFSHRQKTATHASAIDNAEAVVQEVVMISTITFSAKNYLLPQKLEQKCQIMGESQSLVWENRFDISAGLPYVCEMS